eukprot:366301-Chlamydomonas_euryale.AAC.41
MSPAERRRVRSVSFDRRLSQISTWGEPAASLATDAASSRFACGVPEPDAPTDRTDALEWKPLRIAPAGVASSTVIPAAADATLFRSSSDSVGWQRHG